MNRLLLVFLPFVILTSSAQTPSEDNAEESRERRSRRPAPVISPEIHDDGRVSFRLRAPEFSRVALRGQWPEGRLDMTKDDDGLWSVTAGPLEPGVWEYSFEVDGFAMIDPGNPAIKPMRSPRTSILHLPGDPPLIHDFQDVPHGTVRAHTYQSKSLGSLRHLVVYTPPGYDTRIDQAYPAMYLQHGSGDNEATWTVHGKAHWILDNLIAQGRAEPMVIVMMDGHAAPWDRDRNTERFEQDLLEDVLPFVEQTYRVKRAPEARCLVSLSMGGGQSLTIGLRHPEIFGWVGAFSAGTPREENLTGAWENVDVLNRQLQLLWIACGKDDFLLERNHEFIALLTEKKIEHHWLLTDGDHSWPVWRRYLSEFAPLLFR